MKVHHRLGSVLGGEKDGKREKNSSDSPNLRRTGGAEWVNETGKNTYRKKATSSSYLGRWGQTKGGQESRCNEWSRKGQPARLLRRGGEERTSSQ